MIGRWPVFLTAPRTPPQKVLNHVFLRIQDFMFSDEPNNKTNWALVNTANLTASLAPASIPLPTLTTNDFASKTLAEINTFMRTNSSTLEELDLTTSNWLIIDQEGIETNTAIVCEQDFDEKVMAMADGFRAARVPFREAHLMYANLDIANMGFEDFVDEEAGEQPDGTWKWSGPELEEDEKTKEEREAAEKDAREKGWIE